MTAKTPKATQTPGLLYAFDGVQICWTALGMSESYLREPTLAAFASKSNALNGYSLHKLTIKVSFADKSGKIVQRKLANPTTEKALIFVSKFIKLGR